jgi:plastocyanin
MRSAMRSVICLALGIATLGLAACGGGGGGGGASCTPGTTAAFAINAMGISPKNVCVQPSGMVTFTNNDAATHDIVFDTAGCPTVGSIAPAGGQVTATFPTQENCSFHDANNATNTAFQGTVAVTAVVVMGGGY